MSEPKAQDGAEPGTDVEGTADETGDGAAGDAAADPPGAAGSSAAEDDPRPPDRWASELFD